MSALNNNTISSYPPDVNVQFCNWIKSEYGSNVIGRIDYLVHELYEFNRYVKGKYPQFNPQSNLRVVNDTIVRTQFFFDDWEQPRYTGHWEPSKGVKATLWRLVYALTNKDRHRQKGYEWKLERVIGDVFTSTVKLERFMLRRQMDYKERRLFYSGMDRLDAIDIAIGYEALTDTLYALNYCRWGV